MSKRTDKEDRLIREISAALARYFEESEGMATIHQACSMLTTCGPLIDEDVKKLTLRQFRVVEYWRRSA